MPVDERAARILLPGPDVERIEGRQAESIGTLEQVKELTHQLRRLRVSGIPRIGEDQIVRADQFQTAIRLRLVDHDLRPRRVEDSRADERSIHVMETHRTGIGPADTSELQHVAFGFSHANVFKALGRFADDFDERAGLGLWFGATDEDLNKAESASRRALELAPNLAEAHVARGCALSLLRQYVEAGREFEEAIRINPHLFDAYYYFARASFASGDVQRSADLFRSAADARQEDFQSPMLLGQSLRMLGRHEEGREASREGVRRAEHVLALNPVDCRALSLGANHLLADGQTSRGLEWCQRALELYPDDMGALLNAACLRSRLGQKEAALELLERVFARGWGKRDWIEHDPDYEILRGDPRFERLLAKLK